MNGIKKNLVVLSESLPLGGTATFVMNLSRGMNQRDDWNSVAAGLRSLNEVGIQIRDEGLSILFSPPSLVLHEDRVEHLYCHCSKLQTRAIVAGLGSGAFDFLRYAPPGCLRIGMIQSDDESVYELVRSYLPWLDLVAGVSREICRKMELRIGDRDIPVIHQPYGVPMPKNPPLRKTGGPLRILFLGRVIEEQKRVSLMARVMQRTLREVPEIIWTIAGEGPDLASMRQLFANDAKRVHFLGGVPYAEVPAILPEHDVYFLCSDYEGLPLSLLESMGAGLVPVVSDLPSGISEVVNDRNGIRVAIDDEAGYVSGIVRLARNPDLLAAMSLLAAKEVNQSHSIDAMASRWVEMLESHQPSEIPQWQVTCKATAPMEVIGGWKFSPALRQVRRIVKKIKAASGRY